MSEPRTPPLPPPQGAAVHAPRRAEMDWLPLALLYSVVLGLITGAVTGFVLSFADFGCFRCEPSYTPPTPTLADHVIAAGFSTSIGSFVGVAVAPVYGIAVGSVAAALDALGRRQWPRKTVALSANVVVLGPLCVLSVPSRGLGMFFTGVPAAAGIVSLAVPMPRRRP